MTRPDIPQEEWDEAWEELVKTLLKHGLIKLDE